RQCAVYDRDGDQDAIRRSRLKWLRSDPYRLLSSIPLLLIVLSPRYETFAIMSSSNDSPAIAAAPEQVIPLPALKPTAESPTHSQQPITYFLLTVLLLALAFLAASYAARNADAWFHLAAGRALAQGHYNFGVDPFLYTSEGSYWTNHAWLFDLALFKLYGI